MANILVIGTGTIGEPLIGLLADFKKKLKLSEVMFHKRTPLSDEVSKVKSLVKRGAKFKVAKKDLVYHMHTGLTTRHLERRLLNLSKWSAVIHIISLVY